MQLQAQTLKLYAEANGVDVGHDIALLQLQISQANHHKETALKTLELLSKHQNEVAKIGQSQLQNSESQEISNQQEKGVEQ
jgi:hypothetical protein